MRIVAYSQAGIALGSRVTLTIATELPEAEANHILDRLWLEVMRFEQRFSRFLPDSELTGINRRAGMWTPVSPPMEAILTKVLDVCRATNGVLTPFILPALQRAGYTASRVPGYENDGWLDVRSRTLVPLEELTLRDHEIRIPPHSALDLGGFGKGYLAEQLSLSATSLGLAHFWFNLGGDIALAGEAPHHVPWPVHVQDGQHPERHLDGIVLSLPLGPIGVATSGTVHHQLHGGHHIIDPRTGKAAQSDVELVTVVHESPFWADVLASCGIILEQQRALKFYEKFGVKGTIWQFNNGALQRFGVCEPEGVPYEV